VWLSRFDHRPKLEPFLSQGPTHGADNACLWAHLPEFVDRPILGRRGGPMTGADLEVTARFQQGVLRFVATGAPDTPEAWPAFERESESLALFDSPFAVTRANAGERFGLWAEVLAEADTRQGADAARSVA
jgi:para-nitrobenzyl esterase